MIHGVSSRDHLCARTPRSPVVTRRRSRMPRWSTFRTVFLWVAVAAVGSMALTAADLPTASPQSVGMSPERLSRLDAAVQADIAAGRLPGIVVAVARRGKVVYQKAFGVANLATREPMRTDALFRLYSMTK